MKKLNKMLAVSLLASFGGVLNAFESTLPILNLIPGGKLGIANVVTLVSMYLFGGAYALLVSALRTVVSCMLYGGLNAFMYSFSGAVVSCIFMIITKNILKDKVSPIGVSVVGAVSSNITQVAAAWLVLRSSSLLWYLGALILIGVVSGTALGYIAKETLKRIKG